MSSKPLAILGMMHVCPKVDPGPKPHIGGPIIQAGQSHVKFNGIPWAVEGGAALCTGCLLYTSPSPRDQRGSRMPSSA